MPDADATNMHCTGTGLAAFYECTLFPSSISSHPITFQSGNSIDLGVAGYSGYWTQPTTDSLYFEYYYGTDTVAVFYGEGVSGSCFEGLTTFPGSGWVAPYEVCLD